MIQSNKKLKFKKFIKYIDLCSGIGGFRIALQNIQNQNTIYHFKCILSVDIKQDAIDTYNINFNEHNTKTDLNYLKPDEIESFDLLCAGFPCQPFSCAGQKKGFSDKRGEIIFKIIDICKWHKPNYVILENVSNLLTINSGECILRIVNLFEEIGYYVSFKKLNSKNFGCGQNRERVYIVCSMKKQINLDKIVYKSEHIKLKDILDNTSTISDVESVFSQKLLNLHKIKPIYGCKINDKRGGCKNIHSWDLHYFGQISDKECNLLNKILLERRKKHFAQKKNIIWMDGMPLTLKEISTFYNEPDLEFLLQNLVKLNYLKIEKCKDLIKGKRTYKEDSEMGYNICKGKLSFPISKILDPNDVSPTITATDSHKLGIIINEHIVRRLTCNELKKLSGFPDTFIIPTNVNFYDLFGNVATPPVIEAILNLIFQ